MHDGEDNDRLKIVEGYGKAISRRDGLSMCNEEASHIERVGSLRAEYVYRRPGTVLIMLYSLAARTLSHRMGRCTQGPA